MRKPERWTRTTNLRNFFGARGRTGERRTHDVLIALLSSPHHPIIIKTTVAAIRIPSNKSMSNPSSVLVLEEELAVHEATLQTLIRRQQEALDVQQVHLQRQEHVQRLESLQARRETLLQARQRHLNLQHEMQQALEKSQERLARVSSSAASSQQDDGEEATIQNDSQGNENITEQETDTAPAIPLPNLHANDEIVTKFLETKNSSRRLQVLLPCVNSIDLMQRIMNLTALETLALDQTEPQGNHRQETLCKTCLDLLSIATAGDMTTNTTISSNNNSVETNDSSEIQNTEDATIDPNVALCPYELSGECADPYCPYQHMKPRSTSSVLARERLALPTLKLPSLARSDPVTLQDFVDSPPASPLRRKRQRLLKHDSAHTEPEDDESVHTQLSHEQDGSVHTQELPRENDSQEDKDDYHDQGEQEVSMDWNDDFLSLPPASQPAAEEEEDSDDSNSDNGVTENVTVDQEVTNKELQGGESSFWWQTEEDAARMKVSQSKLSSLQLSLTDWLSVVGGFVLENDTDENGLVSTVLKFQGAYPPAPPVQVIAFLGRVVDCVRLCVHAGRFDVTHSLCDYAQTTLLKVLSDMNTQDDSNEHNALVTALRTSVDILKTARDSAFHFNSAKVTTFQCAFQAEVSMAMLNSSLRLLFARISSDDETSDPMDKVFTMLSFVATRFHASETDVRPIPFALEDLSEEWRFLSKIKRDGNLIEEEWQDPSFHLDFVASKVLERGQRIIEVLSECPLEAFAEDVLKPVLNELRQYSNSQKENGSSLDCIPILYTRGYIILGCAQSVCAQIVSRGDQGFDTSTLTAIDSCIYQIVTCLANITSTEPLAELCLAPLNALSVAMAATLRRYGKAQRRLEAALNAVLAKRRSALCGGYLVYSELLWSQMIQLRSSLPLLPDSTESKRLASLTADTKSEHRSIASTAYAFGIQPSHLTLCGDWNMIKVFDLNSRKYAALVHVRKYTFSLLESLFSTQRHHVGSSLFCNLWHLALTETSMAKRVPSSPSLAFPRSTLLVGRELSVIVANNCDLKQLPVTFGKCLPNLKVQFIGCIVVAVILYFTLQLHCIFYLVVGTQTCEE